MIGPLFCAACRAKSCCMLALYELVQYSCRSLDRAPRQQGIINERRLMRTVRTVCNA
jgi:hypothetical protein